MLPVTHVITTIERGGAENQLLILVEAQVNSGRKVNVIFLKGNSELKNSLIGAGACVVESLKGKNPARQILSLRAILKSSDLQILHCHLPRAELIATVANMNTRYPLVISRHNSESFFPKAPALISRLLSKFVSSRANYCVAISLAVKDFLLENGEISSKCPTRVVYYGYPKTAKNYQLKPIGDEKVIGTIARLAPQKDIPTLLRAFRNLTKQADYELLIVGDGELKQKLTELAASLKLSNVMWQGRVSDVSAELSRMHVFVLASHYEGFGLVLLEAMNAGVPIVAARNSAIPEVLGDDYPFLFETGNDLELTAAINRILIADRTELAEKGFQRLKFFATEKMIESLDQIYVMSEVRK